MKKSFRVFVFLCLTSMVLCGYSAAQTGDPTPVPPPTPHGAQAGDVTIEEYSSPTSITLDGQLVLRNVDGSGESSLGYLRQVAQSLLQSDNLKVVFINEGVAFDEVPREFFERVSDFIVTDGNKYFQIVLTQ
ncbi:MAG: hypothetical protein HYR55_05690 [Acidobacteria bacterium]|nr:hypothetical protein [Acidobacteriota bacterium]MBI3656507.1 hypothetical protein [Acidobacteriota bacterium]